MSRPKPLLEIGSEPILLHIMKLYESYGFRRFILCLGYQGVMIKEYFLNREMRSRDMKLVLSTGQRSFLGPDTKSDWEVIFAETGAKTQTGGRIARCAQYIDTPTFMVTYGDGLADIHLGDLLASHLAHGEIGTVTGVGVNSQFGELKIEGERVVGFAEKPATQSLINGGFFVFQKEFLDYLSVDSNCILERDPLEKLAREGKLKVRRHDGFWRCMDTFKDYQALNEAYAAGIAPWTSSCEDRISENAA
ncbi:sugar phosphate nucleotidyltransferase [Variibacter gotjawalensis]|uniref:sugar phosphate nucleotidyltransferase n=1 Tax=Variibacter gotjawalensis TaxID=1333996 RepID=UPI001DC130A0|nr:sugar phosphate nucleotidyltransferase [Variibacter gotjawalensis]NIK47332.1 glucose-1-phosphate cytidylyltransferase [Variibacter gotjawalensis]